MLDMYANKQKLQGLHNQEAAKAEQKMKEDAAKGDPVLAMAGQIAGTAVGTAVGGPMGGKIGGSLGGQLAGTGTVDPTKTLTSVGTGELTGALGDAMGGIKDSVTDSLNSNFIENTGYSPMEAAEYGLDDSFTNYFPKFAAQGGPISYAACGGKMKPKYRAEGGGTSWWDSIKKSFTEKPEWEGYEAVQVPVLDGSGNPTNMTSTVYRPRVETNPYAEEGAYDYEDMGDASYLAGDPESYSVQTQALPQRAAPKMQPLMPPEYEDPYYFDVNEDFSKIKPYRREEPKRKEIPSWMLPYYDPEYNSTGGMAGPLKAVKYKSAGGDVYSKEYDTSMYRWWGSDEPETNYQSAQQLRGNSPTKPYMDPEGAREREIAAEAARAGAEAIGSKMPGALGGMSDYLAKRRKHFEEMNKLLGK